MPLRCPPVLSGLILTILPAFAGHDVLAGWEQVGADDSVYLFADRQTILKVGDTVKMRHLVDYKGRSQESGRSYQSSTVEVEYDCNRNRFRELSVSFHPHRMGEGQVGSSVGLAQDWQRITAGSGSELLGAIACGKAAREKKKKK